jgi:hypothetical protein
MLYVYVQSKQQHYKEYKKTYMRALQAICSDLELAREQSSPQLLHRRHQVSVVYFECVGVGVIERV